MRYTLLWGRYRLDEIEYGQAVGAHRLLRPHAGRQSTRDGDELAAGGRAADRPARHRGRAGAARPADGVLPRERRRSSRRIRQGQDWSMTAVIASICRRTA